MKKIILSVNLLVVLLLTACQKDDQGPVSIDLSGKWQLTKYYSVWTDKYYSAQTLSYEEYYDFKQDSTFRKYRSNGVETGGSYSVKQSEGVYYIYLNYLPETEPDKQDLQWQCNVSDWEMKLNSDNGLVFDNSPCDGPRYYYQKVKE